MTVTIAPTTTPTLLPNGEYRLRIYSHGARISAEGFPILQGSPNDLRLSPLAIAEVTCTVLGKVLSVPALICEASEDATDNPNVPVGAYLFNAQNRMLSVFSVFASFHLPPSPPNTTWAAIALYNLDRATLGLYSVARTGNRLQKWTATGLVDSGISETEALTVIDRAVKVEGSGEFDAEVSAQNLHVAQMAIMANINASGTISAGAFEGDGSGLSIPAGTGGLTSSTGTLPLTADNDDSGTGYVDFRIGSPTNGASVGRFKRDVAEFDVPLTVQNFPVVSRIQHLSLRPEDLGADATGVLDSTEAFTKLNQYIVGNRNAVVRCAANGTYKSAQNAWLLGGNRVRVEGNNARLINTHPAIAPAFAHHILSFGSLLQSAYMNTDWENVVAGGTQTYATFNEVRLHDDARDLLNRNYIDSVPVRSRTIKLKNLAHVARYQTGTRVFIGGYNQQAGGDSYPPNFRYFEWNMVIAVDAGTGILTLENPTENLYDERWFELPAQVIPLDKPDSAWGRELYMENLTIERVHPLNTFNVAGHDKTTLRNMTIDRLVIGESRHVVLENCDITVDCELDKLTALIEFDDCRINSLSAATGVNLVKAKDSTIFGFLDFQPPRYELDNCLINIAGSNVYGKVPVGNQGQAQEQAVIRNTGFVYQNEPGETKTMVSSGKRRTVTTGEIINANTFVVAVSDTDYSPVVFCGRVRIGTLLHAGDNYAYIRNIYTDDGVRILCELSDKTFDLAPGQVLAYRMCQNLIMDGNYWTNIPEVGEVVAYSNGFYNPPAENITINGSSEPIPLLELPTNGVQKFIGVNGILDEIRVFVSRAQVIDNAAFPGAFLVMSLPSQYYKFNLKQTGMRRVTRTGVEVQAGDEVYNPLLTGGAPYYVTAVEVFGESTHTLDSSKALGSVTVKRLPRR